MSESLKANLNAAQPNTISDGLRTARIGSLLSQTTRFRDASVSANIMVLPDDAKAIQVIAAFASAGANTSTKSVVGSSFTLAQGEVQVTDSGDIRFFGTDAVTQAEVYYITSEGEVTTETLTIASSVGFFASGRKGVEVLSAVVISGVTVGEVLTPDARGASPPLGAVSLATGGTAVTVNASNIVDGSLRVTYKATPGQGTATAPLGESLDAAADNLIP